MHTIYKFIPYEKFSLETSLTEEKIIGRLDANVNQKEVGEALLNDARSANKTGRTFQGEISKERFKILGYTKGQDELIPMAIGTIKKNGFGHTIDVTIQFGIIANVFGGIAGGVLLILSFVYLTSLFSSNPTYFPLIGFLAVYAIFMYSFKSRSREYRRFLKEMFAATEMPE